eukprot:179313_1
MPRKVRKKLTCRTKRCTDKQKKERKAFNKLYKVKKENERLRKNAHNPPSPGPPPSPEPPYDTSASTNNKQKILFDSLMPSLCEIFTWANFIFMLTIFLVTVSSVPIKKLELTMYGLVTQFMGSWFAEPESINDLKNTIKNNNKANQMDNETSG